MTQEIIEMAIQASRSSESLLLGCGIDDLKAFAKLVAEAEREACAKLAEMAEPYQAADLIRKRGQA